MEIALIWSCALPCVKYQYKTQHRVADADWGVFDLLFCNSPDGQMENGQPSPFTAAQDQGILEPASPLAGISLLSNRRGTRSEEVSPSRPPLNHSRPIGPLSRQDSPSPPLQDDEKTAASRESPVSIIASQDANALVPFTRTITTQTFTQAILILPAAGHETALTHPLDHEVKPDSTDLDLEFSEAYWTWDPGANNWFHEDSDGEVIWYPLEFD